MMHEKCRLLVKHFLSLVQLEHCHTVRCCSSNSLLLIGLSITCYLGSGHCFYLIWSCTSGIWILRCVNVYTHHSKWIFFLQYRYNTVTNSLISSVRVNWMCILFAQVWDLPERNFPFICRIAIFYLFNFCDKSKLYILFFSMF